MGKVIYYIVINDGSTEGEAYTYSFSNVKDIEITLSEQRATVLIPYSKKKNLEQLKNNSTVVSDAIKRVCWLHLIKYGKILIVKSAELKTNTDSKSKVFLEKLPVYLIDSDRELLIEKVSNDKETMDYLASTKFSEHGLFVAVINSLILAKSRENEYDRFINLWTSYNAFFSLLYKGNRVNGTEPNSVINAFKQTRPDNKLNNKECTKIEFLLFKYLHKSKILGQSSRNEALSIIEQNRTFWKKWDGSPVRENGLNEEMNLEIELLLNDFTKKGYKFDYDSYGFLLSDFPYYLRCNYLHGSKAAILVFYRNDYESGQLKVANSVLETFLDDHILDLYRFRNIDKKEKKKEQGKNDTKTENRGQ